MTGEHRHLRRWFRPAALGLLLLSGSGLGSRVLAQATGIPLRNAGVAQGIGLGADVGFGRINREGGDDKSTAFGATGTLGFGPLGLSLGLARISIDPAEGPDRDQTSVIAGAQLTMIGGPLVPLKVTWHAALAKPLEGGEGSPWRASLGLGGALAIPTVVLSLRPWIAPRLEYLGSQPVSGERFKGALAAGIDATLLSGLGLRVGYDSRLGWDSGLEKASGISVGLSYNFR